MRVLVWHVHGSWATSFVHGPWTSLVPVTPDRGPDGLGRARTYAWPDQAVEVTPDSLRDMEIDAVVLQRPHELELAERWTGRRPGRDLPAVYVEHNTPRGDVDGWRHPLADRSDIPVVHVTAFNEAMWDSGSAPTRVVRHGIPDPGLRYTGVLESLAVCVNEPLRRWRVAGTDLAVRLSASAPMTYYGMGGDCLADHFPPGRLTGVHDLPQTDLHVAMARHRAYLHPYRWTSLGLSLLEAMTLGMPVLVLAATEAPDAVPPDAGLVSPHVDALARRARTYLADPDAARRDGTAARAHALARFGLDRFVADWDLLLKEVTS